VVEIEHVRAGVDILVSQLATQVLPDKITMMVLERMDFVEVI
jgi:hypothetical protein